ncbi:MAG: hypothetical protein ACXW11_08065 [Methylotenera sp.]
MLKPLSTFIQQKFTVIDRLIIKLGDGLQSSLCHLATQWRRNREKRFLRQSGLTSLLGQDCCPWQNIHSASIPQ